MSSEDPSSPQVGVSSSIESGDVAGDETANPGGKHRRFGGVQMMAVAVAVLIVIGGFLWVVRPQDDQPAEQPVAGQEEPTAGSDGDAQARGSEEIGDADSESTEPEATGATPPQADTSAGAGLPAPVDLATTLSETTLLLSMQPLAGSATSDVTLFSWTLPGNGGSRCESSGGVQALVALDSDGVQVAPLAFSGIGPRIVAGPGEQIAIAERCEGNVESVQVGSLAESGVVSIDRWLTVPEGLFFSRFDPVWSADGTQLLVHLQDRAGVLSLGTFDVESGEVEVEQSTGRILAQLAPDVTILATSQSVSRNGQQLLELDPASGGASSVGVQVSADGRHIAIFANDTVVITGAAGPVYRYDTIGKRIWAVDWSPTGQLLISAAGAPSLWTFDINSPGEFTPVPGLAGNWLDVEFADEGKTLTLFGAPEGDSSGQPQTRILRFEPGEDDDAEADQEAREPFGTLDQTVGEQPLALRGIGAIQSGMTVAEAEAAVGGTLVEYLPFSGCSYALLAGDPNSPNFMVLTYQEDGPDLEWSEGIIARIEIGPDAATLSGISVGSTKDEVFAAYGERIEVSPHHYTFDAGGEYLTFVPTSEEDGDYRLVMETADDTVTMIRSGLLPAVEFVEGCL